MNGSLREHRFADLLQIVDSRRKSGVLQMVPSRGGKAVRLFFRGGRLLKVEITRRDTNQLIGEMLVRAGRITSDELSSALKLHKKTLRRLGDVLGEQRATTAEIIQEFVNLQAQEVLHGLFEWTEGEYSFQPATDDWEAVITPVSAEQILLDGFKLLDEWPVVRARINNYAVVYRAMRSAPGGGTERALSASAVSVLALVDAKRDVNQIIDRSGLGEFETCKALSSLLTHGYIVPVNVRGAVDDPSGRQSRGWLGIVGLLLLNLGYLCGIGYGAYWLVGARPIAVEKSAGLETALAPIESRILRQRVRRALEIYRHAEGRYPDSLSDLSARGYLPRSVHPSLDLDPIQYVTIGHDYELR